MAHTEANAIFYLFDKHGLEKHTHVMFAKSLTAAIKEAAIDRYVAEHTCWAVSFRADDMSKATYYIAPHLKHWKHRSRLESMLSWIHDYRLPKVK